MVGPGGAGKSTFAHLLGEQTGLPVLHLDRWYWQPGWVEPTRAAWEAQQAELVGGEAWTADDNYSGTLDVRFRRTDTVVILVPHRAVCVTGALARFVRYHGRAIQADGCPERISPAFLRWIWRYDRDTRPRLDAAMARHPHLRVVELRSRRQARLWLETLGQVGSLGARDERAYV